MVYSDDNVLTNWLTNKLVVYLACFTCLTYIYQSVRSSWYSNDDKFVYLFEQVNGLSKRFDILSLKLDNLTVIGVTFMVVSILLAITLFKQMEQARKEDKEDMMRIRSEDKEGMRNQFVITSLLAAGALIVSYIKPWQSYSVEYVYIYQPQMWSCMHYMHYMCKTYATSFPLIDISSASW